MRRRLGQVVAVLVRLDVPAQHVAHRPLQRRRLRQIIAPGAPRKRLAYLDVCPRECRLIPPDVPDRVPQVEDDSAYHQPGSLELLARRIRAPAATTSAPNTAEARAKANVSDR